MSYVLPEPLQQGRHLPIRLIYYSLVAAAILFLLYGVMALLGTLAVGFLMAYFLDPLVCRLESLGINRVVATALVFVALAVIFAFVFKMFYPLIASQIVHLTTHFPAYQSFLSGQIAEAKLKLLARLPVGMLGEYEALLSSKLDESIREFVVSMPKLLTSTFSAITLVVFSPIIAFFFLVQGDQIKRALVSLVPNRYFEMILMLIHRIDHQVGSYLRGQFLDCVAVGVLACVALSLLHVKYAVIIGIFAGAANAIPYLGPVAGALPGILVLMLDPEAATPWWAVPAAFVLIKLVDDVLIYPQTVGRSLKLPPLAVILGILVGEHLGGILGMLLAVPLIAIGKVVLEVLHNSLKSYRII